ncbi:monovalent cation:proton antiporter-2 (CPA2) family protein [Agitococcus lubricus]|uniref:Kef-type potassium/proton antiporter (CPA2 family) n=1 Tax=Agitococcus lubricus TaxID=1077255 RepID=A0A2T5J0S1_9GAMM|nr:monovalent cation:proton antiporter-2 (CPA2) family protein [Agitococcus lubricus]PTQ89981.1 Kef-type potassium/proton antiporter (CPA2 family) [Agitococcus lubricus]
MTLLSQTAMFLGAALLIVPLCHRLGLATVLGYLITGIIIGPNLLNLAGDTTTVLHFAEFGVVMLLFVIGLELEPSRLWVLRRSIFILGGLQVLVTGGIFTLIGLSLGINLITSAIAGFGLAMSSTAFVMQLLSDKKQLTTRHGRKAFAVLLFQDMAVIPILAILPILSGEKTQEYNLIYFAKVLGLFALLILASRVVIRPVFRIIAASKANELLTAAALFIIIGIAVVMEKLGLSMALGAFVTGVLLADSEYRHELEANIQPFKGLLLGLFFMAVGMSTDMHRLLNEPLLIVGGAISLMLIKFALLTVICRLCDAPWQTSIRLGVTLAQGGEFAFVLFSTATQYHLLSADIGDRLILIVTLSMALTPLAFFLLERFIEPRWQVVDTRAFDEIGADDHDNPVVIAGFGRFGQIVARVLRMHKIGFTAIEGDARQVDFVRRFGNKIYYGNPSHIEMLRAAKLDKAKVFILAIDDVNDSVRTAMQVRHYYPHLTILARARDRRHAYELMDIGVKLVTREMFASSLEVAEEALRQAGLSPERAAQGVQQFRHYDEQLLIRQQAFYHDEESLIASNKQAMRDLEELFESDALAEQSTNEQTR